MAYTRNPLQCAYRHFACLRMAYTCDPLQFAYRHLVYGLLTPVTPCSLLTDTSLTPVTPCSVLTDTSLTNGLHLLPLAVSLQTPRLRIAYTGGPCSLLTDTPLTNGLHLFPLQFAYRHLTYGSLTQVALAVCLQTLRLRMAYTCSPCSLLTDTSLTNGLHLLPLAVCLQTRRLRMAYTCHPLQFAYRHSAYGWLSPVTPCSLFTDTSLTDGLHYRACGLLADTSLPDGLHYGASRAS